MSTVGVSAGIVAALLSARAFYSEWSAVPRQGSSFAPKPTTVSGPTKAVIDVESSDFQLRAQELMRSSGSACDLAITMPENRQLNVQVQVIDFQFRGPRPSSAHFVSTPMSRNDIINWLNQTASRGTFADAWGKPLGASQLNQLRASPQYVTSFGLGTDDKTPNLHIAVGPSFNQAKPYVLRIELSWKHD